MLPKHMTELYYGPPDKDQFCACQYYAPGTKTWLPRRCPNHIDFYVKIPDCRGDDWRKARAACWEHLAVVICQMQEDYGGEGFYTGEYLLRASIPPGG